jgi:protein-S-isoprenylcysteine O-methyltransferase Ste14
VKSPPKTLALLGVALASILGSASLLLLVAFLYLGSFHFFQLGLSPSAALAWDALLCAVFFLQHSGMVRRSFQQRLGRFVPGPFHGVVYTIASGSALILCLVLWQRAGEPLVLLDGVRGWPLRAVFLLAIAGFGWGVHALGSFDTFGVKPVIALLRGIEPRQHFFVIKGPYRWVRHPLYFFAILLFWSCPIITSDRLLFDVLWTTWVVLATMLEERDLVSRFGDSYIRYQNEVPMILPWRIPDPT